MFILLMIAIVGVAFGQSTAVVAPDKTPFDLRVAGAVRSDLFESIRMQDGDMTTAAFDSARPETPLNMTTNDARRVGSVIGTDLYILVHSGTQRRASIGAPDYYEAFAVFYFVSSRTGRLVWWQLLSNEGATAAAAEGGLLKTMPPIIFDLVRTARVIVGKENSEPQYPAFDEIPVAGTPASRGFRAPVPYRRLKPEYTRTAYLYDVTATVEATVDLNEKGEIVRASITRWAGYGLDESVLAAIRSMNWRPAERNGKPLASRFLLRYNFKKIEKDDSF
jgi:hypothetical protein